MSRPKTHAASCRLDYGRKGILVGRRYYNLISKLVDHIIQDFPVTLYGEALRFPTKHKQGILSVIVKIKTTTKLFYRLLQQVQVIGGIVEFNLLFIFDCFIQNFHSEKYFPVRGFFVCFDACKTAKRFTLINAA